MVFLDGNWKDLGTKHTLQSEISGRTGIPPAILAGDGRTASIAQKMPWAAGRRTTRSEDIAYCLLGLFGVNMPLLYEEGDMAFIRLQEEFLKIPFVGLTQDGLGLGLVNCSRVGVDNNVVGIFLRDKDLTMRRVERAWTWETVVDITKTGPSY